LVLDTNSLLWKFRQLEWVTSIENGFGASLADGSLVTAVKGALRKRQVQKDIVQIAKIPLGSQERTNATPNPDRISHAWQRLGVTFDLTYFWMKRLSPELEQYKELKNESDLIRTGYLLQPLLKCGRNLCFGIRDIYEEMPFDGTYGGDYLESIKINPVFLKGSSDSNLDGRELRELWPTINLVFHTYQNSTEEFLRAVRDPKFGEGIGAPSNFSAAEMVIRKVPQRIYELLWILNDIYKGVGYEEPFAMIAKHQTELHKAPST
jgi:hypothetical protein